MLNGKRILLIVGGGIAAYKTLELVRLLRERGARVRAILTQAGAEFVTALSLASLSGDKVYQELFSLTDESEMGHIALSRDADLLVAAPATADLMAKMAHGLANDLASTVLLATDKPVLIVPAMNVRMWEHAATRRNLERLRQDGVRVVGPNEGEMACGEYGFGRMAEAEEIISAIEAFFHEGRKGALSGKRALVTAGPTHEALDPVRYIANRSSGRQGYAIAEALAELGAQTTLVSGPCALEAPRMVKVVRVETAREMMAACEEALPADVAVMAAAVADFRPKARANRKIKKNGALPQIALEENPDILATLAAAGARRPSYLVGFAAETENVIENARAKLKKKGCDLIVANDIAEGAMGGERNTVSLVSEKGVENWPEMSKTEVARKLTAHIAEKIGARP